MADATITVPDLGSLTAGQANDLLLATRGTTGYKMLLSDLAKYMMETYNSSSLAGSAQSVKSAFDSLNNRITSYNLSSSEKLLTVVLNDSILLPRSQKLFDLRNADTSDLPTTGSVYSMAVATKRTSGNCTVTIYGDDGAIWFNSHAANQEWKNWKNIAKQDDSYFLNLCPGTAVNTDFDTLTTPGTYYFNQNLTGNNKPVADSGKLIVETRISSSNYLRQTFYPANPNNGDRWIREYSSGTWNAWRKSPTRAEVDDLNSRMAVNSITNYSTLLTHVKSLAKGVYCIRADNATDAPVSEGVIYTIYKTHPVNDTRAIIVGIPMKTSEDQPIYTAFIGQNASSITWNTNFNLYKGTLPNNTDLLTINTPGIYLLSGTNTYVNCPSTYGVFEVLKHVTTSSNSLRLYRITTVDTVFIRYYTNDSTTGSWIKLPQRSEIDALNSRTNGVLTPITVEGISLTNCAYTSNPFCAMVKFSITVTTAPSDWVKILSGAPSRASFPSGVNSNAFFYFSNFGGTSYIKIYVTNNGDIFVRCYGTGSTIDVTLVYPR